MGNGQILVNGLEWRLIMVINMQGDTNKYLDVISSHLLIQNVYFMCLFIMIPHVSIDQLLFF